MLSDRVSNPGPLIYESGALPIALRGPASRLQIHMMFHWSPSVGKPHMTPVPFIKPTESFADECYEVCWFGHHVGSTFSETDGPNYRIRLDYAGHEYIFY